MQKMDGDAFGSGRRGDQSDKSNKTPAYCVETGENCAYDPGAGEFRGAAWFSRANLDGWAAGATKALCSADMRLTPTMFVPQRRPGTLG